MTFELTATPKTASLADFYRAGALVLWAVGMFVGFELDWWPASKLMRVVGFVAAGWYCTARELPVGKSIISELRYLILAAIVIGELAVAVQNDDGCSTEYDGRGTMEICPD